MTPRENLLSLVRRQGYEWIPVEFMLCPSLENEFRRRWGDSGMDYQQYFKMPWRNVPGLRPDQEGTERFLKYHGRINERTYIDEWGVGHESTPTSMHMTRMHCPLANALDIKDILDYPIPCIQRKTIPTLPSRSGA